MPNRLRRSLDVLVAEAERDLVIVWNSTATPEQAAAALHEILPALIDSYGQAAATVAAEWYDSLRESKGIGGHFSAIPEDIPNTGAHALIGWAQSTAADLASFQSLIHGGMQRRIVNFSRGTVTGASVRDPKARGWQRVGSGECSFCLMLVTRGAVYTKATADFGAHDHCRCSAIPAFNGQPLPVRPYTPTDRKITSADRARTRAWMSENL